VTSASDRCQKDVRTRKVLIEFEPIGLRVRVTNVRRVQVEKL
jgi:hypothetical protein